MALDGSSLFLDEVDVIKTRFLVGFPNLVATVLKVVVDHISACKLWKTDIIYSHDLNVRPQSVLYLFRIVCSMRFEPVTPGSGVLRSTTRPQRLLNSHDLSVRSSLYYFGFILFVRWTNWIQLQNNPASIYLNYIVPLVPLMKLIKLNLFLHFVCRHHSLSRFKSIQTKKMYLWKRDFHWPVSVSSVGTSTRTRFGYMRLCSIGKSYKYRKWHVKLTYRGSYYTSR